jgi:hypothetical protein
MVNTRSPGNPVPHNPFTGIESVLYGRINGPTTCSRDQNAAFVSTALRISHSPLFSNEVTVLLSQAELPYVTHTRWICWAMQCYCVCFVFWSLENYISLPTVNRFVLNFNTPIPILYREVHSSVLHGDWLTAGCKAHTNFADESICLLADNIQKEVVIIHRSPEVLKMLSLSIADWAHLRQQTVEINCKNESC